MWQPHVASHFFVENQWCPVSIDYLKNLKAPSRNVIFYPLLVDEAQKDAASKGGVDGSVPEVSFPPPLHNPSSLHIDACLLIFSLINIAVKLLHLQHMRSGQIGHLFRRPLFRSKSEFDVELCVCVFCALLSCFSIYDWSVISCGIWSWRIGGLILATTFALVYIMVFASFNLLHISLLSSPPKTISLLEPIFVLPHKIYNPNKFAVCYIRQLNLICLNEVWVL